MISYHYMLELRNQLAKQQMPNLIDTYISCSHDKISQRWNLNWQISLSLSKHSTHLRHDTIFRQPGRNFKHFKNNECPITNVIILIITFIYSIIIRTTTIKKTWVLWVIMCCYHFILILFSCHQSSCPCIGGWLGQDSGNH